MSEFLPGVDREGRVVAINFCGGCNPVIDRRDIALEIKDALVERGYAVIYNDQSADAIVQLSGCTADCVAKYQVADRPTVVIAGRTLAAVGTDETRLADLAVAAVTAHFEQRPDPTCACSAACSRPTDATGPAGASIDEESR